MADPKYYKLGIPAAEADSGIKTGAAASKTPGLLLSDGKGGIKGAVPGTDYGYPLIRGNNPPTANTAANLGQMYFDMMARQEPYMYVCVGSTQYGFVWCVLGGEVIDNGGEEDPTINSGAVPPHGSKGQLLGKLSDADYDVGWLDPPEDIIGTDRIENKAVTRDKLANNALYSPFKEIGSGNYYPSVADIGVKLKGSWEKDYSIILTQTNSQQFPFGAELVVVRWGAANSVLIKTDGTRFVVNGEAEILTNVTLRMVDSFGIIGIQKANNNSDLGDAWLISGNVEVVT